MDLFNGYNPRFSRLAILNKKENLYHFPIVCNQCENAYCMNVCPTKAIKRDASDVVTIDTQKCIACGLCAEYCPINMIVLDPETGKAFKCELCQGNPLCIKACPTGALEFIKKESFRGKINE
jgi:Fe-S-cluster-containing hydrogenase component 2